MNVLCYRKWKSSSTRLTILLCSFFSTISEQAACVQVTWTTGCLLSTNSLIWRHVNKRTAQWLKKKKWSADGAPRNLVSNLGLIIRYSGWNLLQFPWVPQDKLHNKRCHESTTASFNILSNELFINRLKPNDPYMGHTAPLTSKRCILYIYSTNTGTEYIKHALYSPFFLLKM
jgi:hypothetical protein